MKANELITRTHEIVVNALSIGNAENATKANKVETRQKADTLVNWFIDNDSLEGLVNHLTDCYEAMDTEGVFGVRGVKTKSGADYVTIKKNASAKFFHRAFNSLESGLVLSGYAPFLLKEAEIKVELSDEEKLIECLEGLGADIACIRECTTALCYSAERKETRLIEKTKAIAAATAAAAADAALAAQDKAVDQILALLDKGTTLDDILLGLAAKQA